ncbi:MAG: SMI1/KNR4 family protein [Candidatus Sericytochromatia bacterium]
MKLEFRKPNPPAKMEDIENYQKKHNIKLPQDYIDFLLENDGVESTSWMFHKNNSLYYDKMWVSEFLSVAELESFAEAFYNENASFVIRECKKNGAIIIGRENPCEISIGIEEHNFGHIFFSCLISDDEMAKVADSFTEFINGFEYGE